MKLMVIDGNSIINRAFYGVHNLSTHDGTPTNAVYGFLTILFKLLDGEEPDALCVCFDRKAPTFRHLAYEGYKAQRKGMPDELAVQMPILKDVLHTMNIPTYEMDGWEADDLIGTISVKDAAADWDTVIVTGDKDSLQLITDRTTVKLITSRMGHTAEKDMTPAAFREEYGFDPIHIIDLKALMGDASDNIPGVKGVGEKTAMALVRRYGSIDDLYAAMPAPEMEEGKPAKPGVVKKLTEGEPDARMSYDLATIRCEAPITFSPEENLRREADSAGLYELFMKLEFSKLIDRLKLHPAGEAAEPVEEGTITSEEVTDRARMEALLERWGRTDRVAVLALPSLDVVCVEDWPEPHHGHLALFFADKLDCYNDFLQRFFASDIKKVSHGVRELSRRLLAEGIRPAGFVFDTEVAAYLLAPTEGSYELELLGRKYFDRTLPKAGETYLAEGAFGPLGDHAGASAALMAHCEMIGQLRDALSGELDQLGMTELFQTVELPLCLVLAEMEQEGFYIDRKALAEFGEMLSARIDKVQSLIFEQANEEFNINSPKQLGQVLFEQLGLPPVKKTKTGYSTNAEVLEKLRGRHPIIENILDYRQLTKLKSTYVDGLSKVIAPDGRIHSSFQNTVTATGRLSSTEPNLQNIPVRTELGAKLRYMFVAGEGKVLVDADYSQIELRLLAHMAGDQSMIDGFCKGEDIHAITASQVFGVPLGEVTPLMRRSAKAVNFGIVYGISPFSLSQDIGVTVGEAKDYMERYFAHYSGIRAYMDAVVAKAREDGYVSTPMGRRRWVPELKSSNFNTRSFGERVALNAPIQGAAADVIKLAMVRVRNAMREAGLAARLVLQVHDELIVECPEAEVEQVKELLTREMEGAVHYAVPLRADSAAGKSWGEAKG